MDANCNERKEERDSPPFSKLSQLMKCQGVQIRFANYLDSKKVKGSQLPYF